MKQAEEDEKYVVVVVVSHRVWECFVYKKRLSLMLLKLQLPAHSTQLKFVLSTNSPFLPFLWF